MSPVVMVVVLSLRFEVGLNGGFGRRRSLHRSNSQFLCSCPFVMGFRCSAYEEVRHAAFVEGFMHAPTDENKNSLDIVYFDSRQPLVAFSGNQ